MRKRSRPRLLLVTCGVIALGLASRRPNAPAVVVAYAGDVLWGALFFLLYALLWPRKPALALATWAVVTTELLELTQLYHGAWALALRATRLGGLLLGHTFLWSDVLCVAVGAALAALFDVPWRR